MIYKKNNLYNMGLISLSLYILKIYLILVTLGMVFYLIHSAACGGGGQRYYPIEIIKSKLISR